jgi:homoserine kinase
MTGTMTAGTTWVRLRLPATSANLGPGFDAMALALELFLEVEATEGERFSIDATGRNADICSGLKHNLLLETYASVLAGERRPAVPLAIRMHNEIPLGMGCGSSAAVRLAGIALANTFGQLGWDSARIVEEAARIEGHPDNAAACWYGGVAIAASSPQLAVITVPPPAGWGALVVLPEKPVATSKARAVLPEQYQRKDAVANVQAAALLAAALTLGRADLMPIATRDWLHQPYRAELSPLLPALLPLAGSHGVMSVTLSGAGPAVLLLTTEQGLRQRQEITALTETVCPVELLSVPLCRQGAGCLTSAW